MSAVPARDTRSLDRSIVHSVAWTGAAKITVQVLSWVATIVVARLLAPDDYGLMSMAGLLIGALQVFSEFGIGSTVIVLRELSARSLAQLNGLAVHARWPRLRGVGARGASRRALLPVAAAGCR